MKCTHAARTRFRPWFLFTGFLILSGCSDAPLPTTPPAASPLGNRSHVPELTAYIVTLKHAPGNVRERAEVLSSALGGNVGLVFERAFQGFVIDGITPAAAAALARNPQVQLVERDRNIQIDEAQSAAAEYTYTSLTPGSMVATPSSRADSVTEFVISRLG